MSNFDDKLFFKVRELLTKFPRFSFLLPHLPIYMGAGFVLFAYTLHKVLDPLPDNDLPVVQEKNRDSKSALIKFFNS